jgi:hypothetical protein
MIKNYIIINKPKPTIEELRIVHNLGSNSNVLRKSLNLFKLVMDNQKNGGSVVIKNQSGEKEIIFS